VDCGEPDLPEIVAIRRTDTKGAGLCLPEFYELQHISAGGDKMPIPPLLRGTKKWGWSLFGTFLGLRVVATDKRGQL